jgi:anti-sigma factor RsiW
MNPKISDDHVRFVDDYVDGILSPAEASAMDAHLSTCAWCRALMEDVSRLRRASAALGPIEPPTRVWTAINAAVTTTQPASAASGAGWEWRQMLAAAAGLVLVASSLTWLGSALPTPSTQVETARTSTSTEFRVAEAAYQTAIDDLESVAGRDDAPAVPASALVALRAGLADLDAVIVEVREELTQQPDDTWSQDSLLAALDSKVVLLQDTVALLDLAGGGEGVNP